MSGGSRLTRRLYGGTGCGQEYIETAAFAFDAIQLDPPAMHTRNLQTQRKTNAVPINGVLVV